MGASQSITSATIRADIQRFSTLHSWYKLPEHGACFVIHFQPGLQDAWRASEQDKTELHVHIERMEGNAEEIVRLPHSSLNRPVVLSPRNFGHNHYVPPEAENKTLENETEKTIRYLEEVALILARQQGVLKDPE
jgi:hypothetical protein